jgi:hypothetical protein
MLHKSKPWMSLAGIFSTLFSPSIPMLSPCKDTEVITAIVALRGYAGQKNLGSLLSTIDSGNSSGPSQIPLTYKMCC